MFDGNRLITCIPTWLHVKIKRASAHSKKPLNFKIMTYVNNIFSSSLNSNRRQKYYTVEVITYDGESYIEEVIARSAEQAQEIAASHYDDVDYTMVQCEFSHN